MEADQPHVYTLVVLRVGQGCPGFNDDVYSDLKEGPTDAGSSTVSR